MKHIDNLNYVLHYFATSKIPISSRKKLLEEIGYRVENRRHRGYFTGAIQQIGNSKKTIREAEFRISIHAPRGGRAESVINPTFDLNDTQVRDIIRNRFLSKKKNRLIKQLENLIYKAEKVRNSIKDQ